MYKKICVGNTTEKNLNSKKQKNDVKNLIVENKKGSY